MKKKLIALVVAIAILSVSTYAFAMAAQDSKTTEDLTRVVKVETQSGDASNKLIWVENTPSDLAKTQLSEMKSFIANQNNPADYFSDDAKQGMSALLPTGTDLSKLSLTEYAPIGIGDYDSSLGDVSSTIQFPTAFAASKTVVVMVGYTGSDGTVVWQALETTIVNGNLVIVFPADLMAKIGHDAALAVLSD